MSPIGGYTAELWAQPQLTDDGSKAVFQSVSSELVAGDSGSCTPASRDCRTDVFVRDLATGRTKRLSYGANGQSPNGPSWYPKVSADGAAVAFVSSATNLVAPEGSPAGNRLVVRSTTNSSTYERLPAPERPIAVGPDGNWVAFVEPDPATCGLSGLSFWYPQTGEVRRFLPPTVPAGSQISAQCFGTYYALVGNFAVSPDGLQVAFVSQSPIGGVEPPKNAFGSYFSQPYVASLVLQGRMDQVKRLAYPAGTPVERGAQNPQWSGNGQYVAFSIDFLTASSGAVPDAWAFRWTVSDGSAVAINKDDNGRIVYDSIDCPACTPYRPVQVRLSRTGRFAAFLGWNEYNPYNSRRLWIRDLNTGRSVAYAPPPGCAQWCGVIDGDGFALSGDGTRAIFGALDPGRLFALRLDQRSNNTFVALGDSYSAGEGLGPFQAGTDVSSGATKNTCHRSSLAYSQRPNNEGPVVRPATTSRAFYACSGATTESAQFDVGLLSANDPLFQFGEPRQTDVVGVDTRWVTLSMGGNDVGFARIVEACAALLDEGSGSVMKLPIAATTCDDQLNLSDAALANLAAKLDKMYRRILDRAPNGRLVVVGYPRTFPANPGQVPVTSTGLGVTPTTSFCTLSRLVGVGSFGLTDPDARRVDDFVHRLNQTIATTVSTLAAGPYSGRIAYADTYGPSVTHTCTGINPTEPTVNGLKLSAGSGTTGSFGLVSEASFHPGVVGQRMIADRAEAAFASLG